MIIHCNGVDYERPWISFKDNQPIFLTPDEIGQLPVRLFRHSGTCTCHQTPEKSLVTFEFPATDLSDRLKRRERIHFYKHLGMRTFALGMIGRLGETSPIRMLAGNIDVLVCIGMFAGYGTL